ncbi:hypothetical protein Ocin01_00097 [Orchesella cincta]|uniref:Uncharacterized protein n=1 Tax=Orchesella cincta TaxID=48709 RepID=A0A1D2NMY3_ORCCI|nr:hypothetical protein Ocin01_00097 [Orchesella cincta]
MKIALFLLISAMVVLAYAQEEVVFEDEILQESTEPSSSTEAASSETVPGSTTEAGAYGLKSNLGVLAIVVASIFLRL